MFKILKYSFYDLMRSRWSYVYFFFYLILGFVLLFLNNDLDNAVITLMNIIMVLGVKAHGSFSTPKTERRLNLGRERELKILMKK